MVVEAAQQQYPSSNAFLPDFCSSRSRPSDCYYKSSINVKEEFHSIPMMHAVDKMPFGFGIHLMEGEEQPILISQGGGMVLSYPHSDLTCIARPTSSKKRSRDDQSSLIPLSSLQQYPSLCPNITLQGRLYASAGATTSGRPADAPPLIANLHHQQDTELDSLIRLHMERLRMGLWKSRKRHCAALLSTLEQQPATVQLKQKEAELAIAKRRNAELLEKVERMAAESQMWFSAAKNNEAVTSSLRTALQQLLLAAPQTGKEGCGDNIDDGGVLSFPADDAQSCCVEPPPEKEVRRENEELRWRRACRGCGEREACVLLLPCRHLCVCMDCQSSIRTCPVCCSDKSASIRVSME